jgi:G3E family GTPase
VTGPRPLTVVSGGLGSGKTTLLRRLLEAGALPRTALLVNELGEVGLDQHQFQPLDERTVLLPGGCVCCSRRDDVADALVDLLDAEATGRSPRVDRVVLETTGIADPAPVAATVLAHPVLRHQFTVDRVVVTVDAAAVTRSPDQGPEWLQQAVCADVLALTKTDLVPPAVADTLVARLGRLNPTAVVLPAGDVRLDEQLPRGRLAADVPALGQGHLAGISTAVAQFDGPVDWAGLAVWLSALLHAHGDRVLRVKGLLDTGGDQGPLLLDGVQHVVHPPRHLPAWDGPRRSHLVVIARDLEAARVTAALEAFLTR